MAKCTSEYRGMPRLIARVTPGQQEGAGRGDRPALRADSSEPDPVSYDGRLFTAQLQKSQQDPVKPSFASDPSLSLLHPFLPGTR